MNARPAIDERVITERILLIEKHVGRLKELRDLSPGEFTLPNHFDAAAWNLRCALEAVFDVAAHVLSRIPGVSFEGYRDMALKLGEQNIIPQAFAEETLVKMAGYRNRLTHFYFEVAPEEMYRIVTDHLTDFDVFAGHIKRLLATSLA